MSLNDDEYKPLGDRLEKSDEPIEGIEKPADNQSVESSEEEPSTGEEDVSEVSEPEFESEQEPEPEENIYPEFEVAGTSKFFTFFAAVRDVTLSPVEFFNLLTLNNGIGYPLAFGVIVYFINSLGGVFFSLVEMGFGINFGLPEQVFASALSAFLTPVISLFFAPIAILVIAIIYHVLFMVFKFDSAGFEGTLRVVTYASAPLVLGIIPICGGIIGFFWSIVAAIVGFQIVCKMTTGWAIFIYLIPLILFCSCVGMLMGLGGLAAFMTIMPEVGPIQEFLQEV